MEASIAWEICEANFTRQEKEAAMKMVEGTARSMGVVVTE